MIVARPYQHHALDGVGDMPGLFGAWESGKRRPLLVLPTGTGKTVVVALAIKRLFPKRFLFIAHRQELIWQARDKIKAVTGLTVDVEMGEHQSFAGGDMFRKHKATVVVSTVQTLTAGGDGGGRIGKFDPFDFDYLVIDEAHHTPNFTYERILEYFSTNPNLRVVGITATPKRKDEKAMGRIFDCVAFNYEIADAIDDGWLVPIDQQLVSIGSIDLNKVRTTAGDLNGADLDAVMREEKPVQGVAGAMIDILGSLGERGIGFASSVHHAKMLSNILNRHRSGMSAWISGKTDKDERKQVLADFKKGNIQFVWNCGVLTEGFDDPGIHIVAMARPTKSLTLYTQMMGRGTRPDERIADVLNNLTVSELRQGMIERSGKRSLLVVDFVGNSGRHKLVNSFDILGGDYSEETKREAFQTTMRLGRPARADLLLRKSDEEVARREEKRRQEEAKKANLVAKTTFKLQAVDPFDASKTKPGQDKTPKAEKPLSDGQRRVLANAGFNPDKFNHERGSELVSRIVERWKKKLCTVGQASVLAKFDVRTDVTKAQASACIDAIKANGWRGLPDGFEMPRAYSASEDMPNESEQEYTVEEGVPF